MSRAISRLFRRPLPHRLPPMVARVSFDRSLRKTPSRYQGSWPSSFDLQWKSVGWQRQPDIMAEILRTWGRGAVPVHFPIEIRESVRLTVVGGGDYHRGLLAGLRVDPE